ncbi:hypothetical protein D9756_001320 [Leucocoprinus leucothites]|uniref:Nephrocystin 3-like N-terminal domain-containing protein n=1 Tax=Leucocoprinus leucothites TaxID=201217 RepID=A0A8H5G3P8_9AGAR|nr:hypothetical protein D9756_001320 [Leucoagaricus leucothites]
MVFDSFIDSLGNFGAWLGFVSQEVSKPGGVMTSTPDGKDRSSRESESTPPPGFFTDANNFVIQHAVMAENIAGGINMFSSGNTVLQHLAPYTNPDAAVDSSARWPPPSCHPGTRVTIGNALMAWLSDPERQWSFVWLYGSAGYGKSAVVQTFAEQCAGIKRLGAAFFFSRPNNRNDPKTVIPSIAYQLATHCSDYKTIITSQLADDPQLLSKAIPVQFKKLIIEPFSYLQYHRYESVRHPFLILLDGLDECQGEAAQCEFIKLINEVVRVKKDLPILWLICSRPEAHLQHTFIRITDCDRKELVIDEECRNDVDRYLRDGFFEVQVKYNIGPSWPSQEKFDAISNGGAGHFVFAATALGFIGDDDYANPPERLDQLIAFLEHAESIGTTNPLAKLDYLYARILSDIPENIFPITWRILAHFTHARFVGYGDGDFLSESAQALCNFVNINQSTFYGALRKLYSLIDVPSPEKAGNTPIRFYHASFQDFLIDASRSEKFAIDKKQALVDVTKSLFFWHGIDAERFHTTDTKVWIHREHDHEPLPGLKWTSGVDVQHLSNQISTFSGHSWLGCYSADFSQDLLPYLLQVDSRYLRLDFCWTDYVNAYYEKGFPPGFCRAEPSSEFDIRLLNYLNMMTNQELTKPASLPLIWDRVNKSKFREYLLIGYGEKSVIVWSTTLPGDDLYRIDRLNCDKEPSPDQISEYRGWLQEKGWYDDADGEESGSDGDSEYETPMNTDGENDDEIGD